jgi:hypothetical protein
MSDRHTAGPWLEDTAAISLEIGAQAGMLDRFRHEINRPANDLRQTLFQTDQPEQADACFRVQVGHEIDVAVRTGLAARQ